MDSRTHVLTHLRTGIAALSLFCAACGGTGIFGPIGDKVANPLSVAVDSVNGRAYVVNSNNKHLYTEGSLHVVNIATPTSPAFIRSVTIENFGAEPVLDAARRRVYVPTRRSSDDTATTDHIVRIDVDESSANFMVTTRLDAAKDPFGVGLRAARDLLLVGTRASALNFYDIGQASPPMQQLDLLASLSDGSKLTRADIAGVTVNGARAVLSRVNGGLLVVNLDELSASGVNPIDYYITGLGGPRGIANDGTVYYVVDVETAADGTENPVLQIVNVGALAADTANVTTTVRDLSTHNLQLAVITVGKDPQQVVVGMAEGFVSNMGADTVTVFSRATRAKVTDISVGDEPFGLALYSPGGVDTHLLVCNLQSNTVSIVDLGTRSVVATYR
ncbi:MAG: hypothetical protein HY543_06970 [Deltaproteobacteria bacterium]|nr:hypothetical protein [Deltaproteobacteria bacterium]